MPRSSVGAGVEKDARAKAIEEEEIARIHRDKEDEVQIVQHLAAQKVRKLFLNEVLSYPGPGRAQREDPGSQEYQAHAKRSWPEIRTIGCGI